MPGSKTPTEQPHQGPGSQPNVIPKQFPQGAGNEKERPRDRLLSPPNQAAIQVVLPAEPKVKSQVQPHSGCNPISIPAVKLVSAPSCCRSHSPCSRIEVDVVEPECQEGWRKRMRLLTSQEVAAPDRDDLLSSSFPPQSYGLSPSPTCNNGGFLQVPNSHLQGNLSSQCLLSSSTTTASSEGAVHSPVSIVQSSAIYAPHLLIGQTGGGPLLNVPYLVFGYFDASPQVTPHCSPNGSPFGSQTCIKSVQADI